MKIVYCYNNENKAFIGTDYAQENPLSPGEFLLPACSTFVEPPSVVQDNEFTVWSDYEWILQEKPKEPEITEPEPLITWDYIRLRRNTLLYKSDWTQLLDCTLTNEQKQNVAQFRQQLRDIPQTYSDPLSVIWPVSPI
jgi:hypothetical protein